MTSKLLIIGDLKLPWGIFGSISNSKLYDCTVEASLNERWSIKCFDFDEQIHIMIKYLSYLLNDAFFIKFLFYIYIYNSLVVCQIIREYKNYSRSSCKFIMSFSSCLLLSIVKGDLNYIIFTVTSLLNSSSINKGIIFSIFRPTRLNWKKKKMDHLNGNAHMSVICHSPLKLTTLIRFSYFCFK